MLYVFTGTDTVAVRTQAHALLAQHAARGAPITTIAADTLSGDMLREHIDAQSLFAQEGTEPQLIFLDTPSDKRDALDAVIALAEPLAASSNVFVVAEGKLLAADAKPLRAAAAEYHEVKGVPAGAAFNVFALGDALANRDKKTLWVLLMRAQGAGLSAESIIGTLFWQLKNMRLAALTGSAAEADLKPFVYNKAKRGAARYKATELEELSASLVSLYHDAHLGLCDIDIALERWALEI